MSPDNDLESELKAIPGNSGEPRDLDELVAIAGRLHAEYRLPQPSVAGMARGRERLMAALEAETSRAVTQIGWGGWLRNAIATSNPIARLAYSGVLAVAFLLSCNTVLTISAESLPGDPLYTFKRVQEQMRFSFTLDEAQRGLLQIQFDDARVREVEALQRLMRVERAEFSGVVESVAGRSVVVSGLPLEVPPTIDTSKLRVGTRVRVVVETEQDGKIIVIDLRADEPAGGGIEATETAHPTSTATGTPRPIPTATAEPTQTLRPTETPRSAEIERPENPPEPTLGARATATEGPEATATSRRPTAAPKATATREPTDTPRGPDATKSPDATKPPDATKSPDATKTR